jgi:hypothetical protein
VFVVITSLTIDVCFCVDFEGVEVKVENPLDVSSLENVNNVVASSSNSKRARDKRKLVVPLKRLNRSDLAREKRQSCRLIIVNDSTKSN